MNETAGLCPRYDTVIVGAGPAGANLARLLGKGGEAVLLVDGSEARGPKVCAGLLSPDAQAVLARYDVNLPSEVLASPQLFSVRVLDLGSERLPMRRYLRNYVNMDRAGFDALLRGMVPPNVTVLRAVCTGIARERDGFSLTLLRNGETVTVSAARVCGADGSSSVVRRSLFRAKRIKRYVALQEWYPSAEEDSYYSCIFDRETSESCSWIFFKDGTLVFGGAFDPKNARASFEAQKEKLVRRGTVPREVFGTPIRTEACTVSRPTLFRGIFLGGGGAYLVGEAAGLISPSSLEGISYALSASEALADAILHGGDERAVLRRYRRETFHLRQKVRVRCLKRPFQYFAPLRALVLRLGVGAIREKSGTAGRPAGHRAVSEEKR